MLYNGLLGTCYRRSPSCSPTMHLVNPTPWFPGVPSLSVPSMEPLHVSGITIESGAGPVRISQIYKNVRLHGLTTSKLNNYK